MAVRQLFLFIFVTFYLTQESNAHGGVTCPPPRGMTCPKKPGICSYEPSCKNNFDYKWFFPAGDKGTIPGSGKRSQEAAGGTWSLYDPKNPSFKFRAGVCGDMAGDKNGEHLRGGKYYWPSDKPAIVGRYKAGEIFTSEIAINSDAHHNGYIEYMLCDVAQCGGEISEACLRSDACQKLKRPREEHCETNSQDCAPIDPKYPTRWFIPCAQPSSPREDGRFEYKNIKFLLPKDVTCEHCVLQFYWTSANTCSPPGYVDYFEGPRGPKWWGECKGQSGARGGWVRGSWHKTCGGNEFPEEYYQCLDIAISPGNGGAASERTRTISPTPAAPTPAAPTPVVPTPAAPTPMVPTPIVPTPEVRRPEPIVVTPAPATVTPAPRSNGGNVFSTPEPVERKPIEPTPESVNVKSDPDHPLDYVRFYVDGKTSSEYEVSDGDKIELPEGKISMEAVVSEPVNKVQFRVEGEPKQWDERNAPYFWGGDWGGRIGVLKRRITDRYFWVRIIVTRRGKKYNSEIMVKL